MTLNKLGLTESERTFFYSNGSNKLVAELREYDPVSGFLKMWDSFKGRVIEFLWDSSSSSWKGTGSVIGYVAEVSISDETPLSKTIDKNVPAKATTTSRFPT